MFTIADLPWLLVSRSPLLDLGLCTCKRNVNASALSGSQSLGDQPLAMERAHPYVSLDTLDVRLRCAEHSLTRHARQLRGVEAMQVNIQNSAASATYLNTVGNQVHAIASRVRDLEAALEIIAPFGPDLDESLTDSRARLVALENPTWLVPNFPRMMCRTVIAWIQRVRLLAASCRRCVRRWIMRAAPERV